MCVCLLLGEPAGQYFRAAIRGGSAINIITVGWKMSSVHTALYAAREREREDGKKIQHERKQMQGGAVQMVVNLSRLANKQCFSVIIHKTALIALYHLTDAPCLSTTGCSGLSIIRLEARWLVCEWADLVQKAGGIIYRPLH